MILKKKKLQWFWKRKYKYDMEIIWLENQNYDNNIEMIMNDIDIHDIDNGDKGNYMMRMILMSINRIW